MTEPLSVSFTITEDDVVRYVKLQQRTLNRIGVTLGLISLLFGAGFAIALADLALALWFGLIGLIFLVSSGTDIVDRWRVRRSARSLVGSTASFTFDEQGIAADTVTGTGRVPWSSLTRLLQSDTMLLVKRDRIPVAWIPKRAFATAAEMDGLVDFIERHLGTGPTAATTP